MKKPTPPLATDKTLSEFSTTLLSEAAYALSQGLTLIEACKNPEGRVTFRFSGLQATQKVSKYYAGGRVRAQHFFDCLRTIKDVLKRDA